MKQYRHTLKFILLAFLALGIVTCSGSLFTSSSDQLSPQERSASEQRAISDENAADQIHIWWTQGFLPEENATIERLVEEWKTSTGVDAELILLPHSDILKDAETAIDEGRGPDILFSYSNDTNLLPRLAWRGQLVDVSDLIEPIQADLTPTSLEASFYLNGSTGDRHYYAYPFGQNTVHLHYWKNLLEETGLRESSIPQAWDSFWAFWKGAQDRLRQRGNEEVFGLGLCVSARETDTFWPFEQFLDAYNIKIVNEDGTLRVDDPAVKAGIATVIEQFSSAYLNRYVPPGAVDWSDSGNNTNFLEGQSLITLNSTLSIPFTQRQPVNQYNQQSNDLYFNQIRTIPWPNKPDGEAIRTLLSIKQVALINKPDASEEHQAAAKSFLQYFAQPQNVDQFLQESTKGRIFPVLTPLLDEPFWNNPQDPHLAVARRIYQGPTRSAYPAIAPAYSQVLEENVWARAILEVIQKGATPDQAAEGAIARIKEIFAAWQ